MTAYTTVSDNETILDKNQVSSAHDRFDETATLKVKTVSTVRPTATYTVLPTKRPTYTSTPTASATSTPVATSVILTATPLVTFTPFSMIEPTPVNPHHSLTVPILMYHYLSDPPANADAIRLDLSVPPAIFDQHLAYLKEAGYQTISLQQFHHVLAQQIELPPKPIILTFDDGYRDAYQYAFPLLKKYDYTATFFVFTQPIDTYNVDFLTWEMIAEMHQAGMEFGSHSYTHPDMRNRNVDYLVHQIVGSKEAIEKRTGEPVRFFCYPSGRYDQAVIEVLDSAHFWGAVTTQWGSTHSFNNRFKMSRVRIHGTDSAERLAAILRSIDSP
ncbi:polysaccharide deacetylase family protein [Anaerolineales bacterium HSG6]|nr:polysaccharide deacetylase family protein [Anaerolineales bacterium HSG6]